MNEELTPQNANRLALGLARQRRIHYREAEAILRGLTLNLVIDAESCRSVAFQAALLTAFNSGNRAFLGGVSVEMPSDVKLLLPLPGCRSLLDALRFTGFTPRERNVASQTIFFGHTPVVQDANSCRADCDGWRGAVSDFDHLVAFEYGKTDDFALGGVLAGGLAVHRCFLKAANISARSLEKPLGLSLWSPGGDWQKPAASSPLLCNLPNRFWMLGLGHLGQAFLWNLALLPFPKRQEIEFLLQDFDVVEIANFGTGLLCTPESVDRKKARHCAAWLERMGFSTVVTERKYTEHDRWNEDEPGIALCGFDRARPRSFLGKTGFGMVLECGLGDSLMDFDTIHTHVFPHSQSSPESLWGNVPDRAPKIREEDVALFSEGHQPCGQLAIDTAGKAVSTSFVGAIAGAIVVGELLRRFNGGPRFEEHYFTPRNLVDSEFSPTAIQQSVSELAQLGFRSL